MPIPTPRKSETKSRFIRRCMSNLTMVKEYPERQRYAICESSWSSKRQSINIRTYSDPTKTIPLRNRFARQMRIRFNRVINLIRQAVWREDVFGIEPNSHNPFTLARTPGRRAFQFKTSQEKVDAFLDWLENQVAEEILETIPAGIRETTGEVRRQWTDQYIHSSYQKGIERARNELIKGGLEIPVFEGLTMDGFLLGIEFNKRIHVDRLGLLYSRTFSELKGITADMDQKISRVLAQGIADGLSPRKLARELNSVIGDDLSLIDKLGRFIPAKRRAELLARTEIIRAHVEANLMEYKEAGINKVRWIYGGVRSCEYCEGRNGQEFTLKEAQNLIPAHPQCGCAWSPIVEIPR